MKWTTILTTLDLGVCISGLFQSKIFSQRHDTKQFWPKFFQAGDVHSRQFR